MQGEYYSVNGEKFLNYYPAVKRSGELAAFAEYIIPQWHIDAFKSVDVPTTLEKSPEYWIDKKLDWLHETYTNTQLLYSGGTDSHTILLRSLERGHRFDRVIALMKGIIDIEYVDMDCYPGAYFLKNNPHIAKQEAIVYQLSEKEYEVWLEDNIMYNVCDFHFCFYPSWKSRMNFLWDKTSPTFNGHGKPTLYKKDGKYYWFKMDDLVDMIYFDWHCDIFNDGHIPELAVHQAYIVKHFFEEHIPDAEKTCELISVPRHLRAKYHHALGRLPAQTKIIEQGDLVGKNPGLSQKHINAMDEIIRLGRWDIIDGWNKNRLKCIEDLKDISYGIEIKPMATCKSYNNGHIVDMPKPVQRIGFCFRLDDEQIVQVDHTEIFN